MPLKYHLEYVEKRSDNMWEACYMEEEGLFVVGVRATKEGAIKEAKQKVIDARVGAVVL